MDQPTQRTEAMTITPSEWIEIIRLMDWFTNEEQDQMIERYVGSDDDNNQTTITNDTTSN